MRKYAIIPVLFLLTMACSLVSSNTVPDAQPLTESVPLEQTPSETIPPFTPLATLTPSQTLRPPPTFAPPTRTPSITPSPTLSATPTIESGFSIEGLRGAETPTPSTTPGCEVREDWTLEYVVQMGDALGNIAPRFNTSVDELAAGNCLTDVDTIVIDQRLRVPGDSLPTPPPFECREWVLLTPPDNTLGVGWDGTLTLNWRGPRAAANLIRITGPDGAIYERVVQLRQNEVIDLEDIPDGGNYTWQVFPLDGNFVQPPDCKESGPWRFTKEQRPPDTPTPTVPGISSD